MLTKNISFKNFKVKGYNKKVKKILDNILVKKNSVLESLNVNYKNSYNKKTILKFRKYNNVNVVGMGGLFSFYILFHILLLILPVSTIYKH